MKKSKGLPRRMTAKDYADLFSKGSNLRHHSRASLPLRGLWRYSPSLFPLLKMWKRVAPTMATQRVAVFCLNKITLNTKEKRVKK